MSHSTAANAAALSDSVERGEIELLRKIDRKILEISDDTPVRDIEDLFIGSLAKFAELQGLSPAPIILVSMGNELQRLRDDGDGAERVPLTASLRPFLGPPGKSGARMIERAEDPDLFEAIGAGGACLVGPVYTPASHLLCLLVVSGASEQEDERLRQPLARDAMGALRSQLTIAYRQFERARFHRELHDLWAEFLDDNLAPTTCFQRLAKAVPRFLPSFGPLDVTDAAPETQILMLLSDTRDGTPEHLVIRGTTGSEHSGTRVALDRSISGLLIADPQIQLFCVDPTVPKLRGYYKSYLGESGHPVRTELAVRMKIGDRDIGVINIESRREDAFSFLHQQTLLELAGTFGRFASVLEQRLQMNTEMQNSVATSTRNYLEALAHTYRHGINTPLTSQSNDAYTLGNVIGRADGVVKKISDAAPLSARQIAKLREILIDLSDTQERLMTAGNETARFSDEFIDDISGYADEGRIVLREIVDSAIQLAENSLLKGDLRHVRIKVIKDASKAGTEIFCSTLIKQHFYSIFHNAVDAIRARLETDGRPGRIAVYIAPEGIPKGQEQSLNRAWVVRIRDNGRGVTAEQLEKLRKFDPGTTFKGGGNGHGLTAAERYVRAIGGRMELNSVRGRFFETVIHFDEYNPLVHGDRPRLSRKDRPNG